MTTDRKTEDFELKVISLKRYALMLIVGFLLVYMANQQIAAIVAWVALPIALMCLAVAFECFSYDRLWSSKWASLTEAQRKVTNIPALRANAINAGGAAVVLLLVFALGS